MKKIVYNKKRKFLKIVILSCIIIIFTTGLTYACKIIIKYNPFNGKPIIIAGEEIPEELIGEEVSLMIPTKTDFAPENEVIGNVAEEINVVVPNNDTDKRIENQLQHLKELEENFERIMYKYHGKEKIDQILSAMNDENPGKDIITEYTFPKSGKKLLYCVIEIFETMNPTEEEKQVLREFSQNLVGCNRNQIDDEELKERIDNL